MSKPSAPHRSKQKSGSFTKPGGEPRCVDESTHAGKHYDDLTTLSTVNVQFGAPMSGDTADVPKERSKRYEQHVQLVGMRLKVRRMEEELTQGEVERRTGIDKGAISRIEAGLQKEMSAGNFFALCEALNYDPALAWYGPQRREKQSTPPPSSTERPSSRPPRSGQKT